MKKKRTKKTSTRPASGSRATRNAPGVPPHGVGVKVAPRQPPPAVLDPVGPSELSPQHQRFVSEYLIDLNATAAYRRSYGAVKDADVSGPRLLGHVGIAAAIAIGKARQLAENELSAIRVLEELRRCAFANVRDYFDPDTGDAKHPHQLTAEQGAALAGFEVLIKNAKAGDGVTDTIHKFKLWDKVHSLELLAKHFALLVEKIELKSVSADARVARLIAARKRVGK